VDYNWDPVNKVRISIVPRQLMLWKSETVDIPKTSTPADFWSYLSFLEVPGIGKLEKFITDYCKVGYRSLVWQQSLSNPTSKGDEMTRARLRDIVYPITIRRTYKDRLFSLPIIKLPDMGERTVSIRFCEAEALIYKKILSYSATRINCAINKYN
jgi:hypothetical protein